MLILRTVNVHYSQTLPVRIYVSRNDPIKHVSLLQRSQWNEINLQKYFTSI